MLAQCPPSNEKVVHIKKKKKTPKKQTKKSVRRQNNQQNQTQGILKYSDSNVEGFHGEDGQQA